MQDWISQPGPWFLLIAGVLLGAAASWVIARHYYRQTPEWAVDLVAELKAMQAADEDVDFVATFERALKDHDIVIDGGKF